ncbi:MAG: hypothetical protein FVQ80_07060 [Planctomycetes bacterium]|nr:hypothetical protein [Planctomycetota bacterium]
MVLLSDTELAQIKSDVQDIIQDTSINTTIRYRQFTGEDYYDPQGQSWQSPYTNWSGVSAVKGLIEKLEDATAKGVEIGDVKFVIMQSAVSNALSVSDIVVESGTSYDIKAVKYDPLGIVYQLYCRAV